ncbi:hypothetical protein M0657_010159 [Pyricularia oryzae]|nr:hypothetical protein M0657_010159 [Pyricularia oryzae]KAI7914647.1 hypothetical protein M9X92_008878 [Pyricularia oryzae]
MKIALRIIVKQSGREAGGSRLRQSLSLILCLCVCEWMKPDDVGAKNSTKTPGLAWSIRLGSGSGGWIPARMSWLGPWSPLASLAG